MDGLCGVWHGGPFSTEKKFRFYPKLMMFGTDPVAMHRILLEIIETKRNAEGALSLWDSSMANVYHRAHLEMHKNTYLREPGHIQYAAEVALGENDRTRRRRTEMEL